MEPNSKEVHILTRAKMLLQNSNYRTIKRQKKVVIQEMVQERVKIKEDLKTMSMVEITNASSAIRRILAIPRYTLT